MVEKTLAIQAGFKILLCLTMKKYRKCPQCKTCSIDVGLLEDGTYCEACGCAVVTSVFYSSALSISMALLISICMNQGQVAAGLLVLLALAIRVFFLDKIDARIMPISKI